MMRKMSVGEGEDGIPTLVVGIGGCTGAGKTTLAGDLARVFGCGRVEPISLLVPAAADGKGGEIRVDLEVDAAVLHQDDFFVERHLSPPCVFRPLYPADSRVVIPSKEELVWLPRWVPYNDGGGHGEGPMLGEPWGPPGRTGRVQHGPHRNETTAGGAEVMAVHGPNRDCLGAVRWSDLLDAVADATADAGFPVRPAGREDNKGKEKGKENGKGKEKAKEEGPGGIRPSPSPSPSPSPPTAPSRRTPPPLPPSVLTAAREAIARTCADHLGQLRRAGATAVQPETEALAPWFKISQPNDNDNNNDNNNSCRLRCRLLIVEGFLLLARRRPNPTCPSSQDHFADVAEQELQDGPAPELASQAAIHDSLALKLFLPLTPETARERRLGGARPAFVDPFFPDSGEAGRPKGIVGGGRKPGELWKSEGYFWDVAWPFFQAYHAHILCDFRAWAEKHKSKLPPSDTVLTTDGVRVHVDEEAPREVVLLWAVRQVMARLAEGDASYREGGDTVAVPWS